MKPTNNMDKLKQIISMCKGGVYLEINTHRNVYQKVEDFFIEQDQSFLDEISEDVYKKMIETDTLIDLQFYPHTPIGFYKIFHYDLEKCLSDALEILNK